MTGREQRIEDRYKQNKGKDSGGGEKRKWRADEEEGIQRREKEGKGVGKT